MLYSKRDFVKTIFRVSSLLSFFEIREKRWDFFQHEKELSPENFQRDAFYYKDTLDDTRNLHGFYFHIYTHTHHARCYRTRARPGCWVMREVRFRLSASKNFMKEKKMCLTHEFLDPFVSRVASECFFFLSSFPLSKLSRLCRSRRLWSSSLEQRERSSHWVVTRPIIESISILWECDLQRGESKRES